MPTGYTAELDDQPTLTTAKWVTKHISRAFGVCVTLRDGPYGLSSEEIEAYLKKEVGRSTDYHKKNISKAEETLRLVESDPNAWNDLYLEAVDRRRKSNTRSIKEADKNMKRHEQVKEDLIKLRDNTTDEITRNIAEFGLNQLEIAKSDCEPYTSEIPDLEKFKADKNKSLNWNIEYHTKEMRKTEERERKRLQAYQTLRSEVARILEVQSSTQKVNKNE